MDIRTLVLNKHKDCCRPEVARKKLNGVDISTIKNGHY
jgi:hypothetical protein